MLVTEVFESYFDEYIIFGRTYFGVDSAEALFLSHLFPESRHCHRHFKLTRQYTLLNRLKSKNDLKNMPLLWQ